MEADVDAIVMAVRAMEHFRIQTRSAIRLVLGACNINLHSAVANAARKKLGVVDED